MVWQHEAFRVYQEKRKAWENEIKRAEMEIDILDNAARVFGLHVSTNTPLVISSPDPTEIPKPAEEEQATFVATALQVLHNAHPNQKAGRSVWSTREVRDEVETILKRKFGRSTCHSTLARLAKEGTIARVNGNNWLIK